MRFIVYGAGAVGGVVGAELSRAGSDVVLIARGRHLDALQSRGVRYETPSTDVTLKIPAVGHPREIDFRDDDVVVLTMKTQHTVAALEDLHAACSDRVAIMCCQNGVANERFALRRFPRVYAMCVNLPAQFLEPGRVQCHAQPRPGVLDFGRYPKGVDDLSFEIADRLEQAGFSARAVPNPMRLKYAKLLMNLANGLNAIVPKGQSYAYILERLTDEGRACYRAADIDSAEIDEVKARSDDVFEIGEVAGAPRVGGSSRQSLVRGTGDIEADYLNGEIVLLGRLHGIPTPANAVVQRLANESIRQNDRPYSMDVDQVQVLIDRESGRH